MLAFLAGIVGVAIGYGITVWFQSQQNVIFMTDLPVAIPFRMDTRVLVASLALAVFSAVVCGLVPALQSCRTDLVNGLKSSEVDVPGRKHLWGRNALVVAQVSTSLMLLTASFLMFRGFQHSVLGGTAFAKDHVLMASFDPRLMQYNKSQTAQFYKELIDRMREAPGVRSAALTQNVPLGVDFFDWDTLAFVPDGFEMPPDRDHFTSLMDAVDQGYFETMSIPVLRGRGFRDSDTADTPRVVIVNEQFAKHYWPSNDALGQRIRLDNASGTLVEIIGVVQTIKMQDAFNKPSDFVYVPMAQHPRDRMTLLVRSDDDPLSFVQPVKKLVHTLDPNMPVLHIMTYEDLYLNQTVRGPGIAIKLVGAMGIVGLLMAVAGLYGVVAYNVSRRTREIGIRMAIGARSSDVLRLILGKGLLLVASGIGIGLVMGFGVERMMNAMLFNVGGVDVLAYAIVLPALFLVTLLAAYLPARRASRIAPTKALRYE